MLKEIGAEMSVDYIHSIHCVPFLLHNHCYYCLPSESQQTMNMDTIAFLQTLLKQNQFQEGFLHLSRHHYCPYAFWDCSHKLL